MNQARMDEAKINASLDAFLNKANEGDTDQARQFHGMLDSMLSERETGDGRMWLTDHARMLLAEMHRRLSRCEGSGERLHETVMDAVRLSPHRGHWQDSCEYLKDLRVAISVANELCRQKAEGNPPDIDLAADTVAETGECDLEPARIRDIYDRIASTVGGFREIASG